MKWTYKRAANCFLEADAIGNGHMGGMVYGGIENDRIDLSELTFFSGARTPKKDNKQGADKAFYQMRGQLEKNDFEAAKKTAEKFIGYKNNYGTNLPVGHLEFKLLGIDAKKAIQYKRELDFEKGIASSEFQIESHDKNLTIERQCYISWTKKVLVYHLKSSSPISMQICYYSANNFGCKKYCKTFIRFSEKAYEGMHSDGKSGVHLFGEADIQTDGIYAEKEENCCRVEGATSVTCYVCMETDFNSAKTDSDNTKTDFDNIKTDFDYIGKSNAQSIQDNMNKRLQKIKEMPQESIRQEHIVDIGTLMNRVSLEIEFDEQTKEQMKEQTKEQTKEETKEQTKDQTKEHKIDLLPNMFQFGRYLLLSSSREDSHLPTHLQGIWNDNVACRIGWTCDMHLDINTQMNYWPANITGLPEMTKPLFRWIEEKLIPSGRIAAKMSYGLSGWIGEIVSNAWGYAAPYWASPISPCPTGGVWILSHMWEHEAYWEDAEFLKTHIYPAMYEAAEFFHDYVFETKDGLYSCGPSISPENSFLVDNDIYQISNGCTYEILMIRELFEKLYEIEEKLGEHTKLGFEVYEMADRLLPYTICENKTIAEWNHTYKASDTQHRHTSHLLGLYPFSQITVEKTPELAAAAKETLRQKYNPFENFEDTGWARSMLMLYSARLQEGEEAYLHIESMLHTLLAKNHFIIHPPTRGAASFDNVYELDGNTGLCTCIAEMLLQSHDGVIRLLPALPKAWKSGKVKGLRARGNIEVSIAWENGRLIKGELKGKPGKAYEIEYEHKKIKGILNESGELSFCS